MKTIGSLGLIRGLIAQIIGTALGMGLVMFIRQLGGKPPWQAEPVIVVGALIGAVAFLAGAGGLFVHNTFTIASLIEKRTGLMAVPVINITHEGFGRAFVLVGKLIVVDKTLRDVHRFGFPSLEDLCAKTEQIIEKGVGLIEKFREVAEA